MASVAQIDSAFAGAHVVEFSDDVLGNLKTNPVSDNLVKANLDLIEGRRFPVRFFNACLARMNR